MTHARDHQSADQGIRRFRPRWPQPVLPELSSDETREAILQAFSCCETALTPAGAQLALKRLALELAAIRSKSDSNAWRYHARKSYVHPIHGRLREDPYIDDAFRKRRGFAGDAATLDFVYGHRSVPTTTRLGKSLFAVTTAVPIAEAVRERCRHIASRIRETCESGPTPTIVSIACGHMRELHLVPGDLLSAARLIGLDQDPQAIRDLAVLHRGLRLVPMNATIRSLLTGTCQIPKAHLIYASGLYDYLEYRTALQLTQILGRRLYPGGVLLLSNLSPHNEEIAFMEAVMDWWMVYRSVEEMTDLATGAVMETSNRVEEVYAHSGGRLTYARIRRPG